MSLLQRAGQHTRAVALFTQMERDGVAADVTAYNSAMAACAKKRDWQRAWSLFSSACFLFCFPVLCCVVFCFALCCFLFYFAVLCCAVVLYSADQVQLLHSNGRYTLVFQISFPFPVPIKVSCMSVVLVMTHCHHYLQACGTAASSPTQLRTTPSSQRVSDAERCVCDYRL